MSNLILNIRVGLYHLQITNRGRMRVSRNESHVGYPRGFFAVYEFFGMKR